MKKSNLKYVFLTVLMCTIYSLYHYNKKFFESSDSVYKKNARSQSGGGAVAFSSGGGSTGESFNMNDVAESSSIGVEVAGSNAANESRNFHSSGISDQGSSFSSSYAGHENQNNSNQVQEYYDNTTNIIGGHNNGGDDGLRGVAMPTMAIGVPTINDDNKEEEDERKEKEVSSNQTAGGRSKFFETVSNSGGTVDLPMAPGLPDEEIPLDGGASILLVLGSIAGVKKLFFNKNKSV